MDKSNTPKEEKKSPFLDSKASVVKAAAQSKGKHDATFEGVDATMEITEEEQKQLLEFETVNVKDKEVDFDKVQLADLGVKKETRRVPVPRNRFQPLRTHWDSILKTLVEHMKLQVRMNTKRRAVELRTSDDTEDIGAIQKAADFLKAFMLGFEIQDAVAILRLDDLYMETFQIKDVKTLHGDHAKRCIGRICGENGKTKYAIENATRTRIVVADSKIHMLGCYSNIQFARDSICSLILGSPPGKVYSKLRTVSKRLTEKF